MAEEFTALRLLRELGDFSDPTGPAARLQTETLAEELRRFAEEHPEATFRITEDGSEQTAAEILAEFEAENKALAALKEAWAAERRKMGLE
ncbi:MAG: hypothetical protein QOG72_1848 [Sphingomonadales bacterium]|jgi:hypothetical protein|nr:hypothetical protein [Sphingomonadales bacterium]